MAKINENTLLIVAGIILVLMFMQGQTQAVTGDQVFDTLKQTGLDLLNTISGSPLLLIFFAIAIVGVVLLGKRS